MEDSAMKDNSVKLKAWELWENMSFWYMKVSGSTDFMYKLYYVHVLWLLEPSEIFQSYRKVCNFNYIMNTEQRKCINVKLIYQY
jgi:hypothetical protein